METELVSESYVSADAIPAAGYSDGYVENIAEVVASRDARAEEAVKVMPMFSKVIRWIIYATVFLFPILFLPFTSDTLELNKQALLVAAAALGMVLYLIDVIRTGMIKFRPSIFYWPVLVLVVAGGLSLITSVSRWTSLFGSNANRSDSFVVLLSLFILFFLLVNTDEDGGQTIRRFFYASIFVTLVYGLLQLLGVFIFKGQFAFRFFNSTGSLNSLGILAAVSLSFYNFLSSSESPRFKVAWNIMQYVGFFVALFIVVILAKWQFWSIAIFSLIASVGFSAFNSRSAKKRMAHLALPMAVTVFGILLLLSGFNFTSVKKNLPPDAVPSLKVAFNISKDVVSAKPLGYGLENFSIAYEKYKPSDIGAAVQTAVRTYGSFIFSNRTSQITTWISEGGIPMALAILLILISIIWFTVKQIKNNFQDDSQASRMWASTLGIVFAMFIFNFNVTLMSAFVVLLAMAVTSLDSKQVNLNLEKEAKYSFIGSVAFVVGLVVSIIGSYFVATQYLSNIHLAKAYASKDYDQAISELVAGANINSNDDQVYIVLAQSLVNKFLADNKSGPKNGEDQNAYVNRMQKLASSAVDAAIVSTQLNPANSQTWLMLATVYHNMIGAIPGSDVLAIKAYNDALVRNPDDSNTYFQMGNASLANAQFINALVTSKNGKNIDINVAKEQFNNSLAQAEESYKKSIELDPNFGQAILNLGLIYDTRGKIPEAIKEFEKLAASTPNDPSLPFEIGILYYRDNKKDKAFDALQKAVAIFPNYSNARWYLSFIYEEKGDLQSALAQVKEIEKTNGDNDLVKERITKLESGIRIIPPAKVLDQKPVN